MVKPESKFLWITTENELSLKPNKAAMKKVYNSFKRNGINLHIDCGSDSEDFVTGKKWGNLSQADIIPYEEIFETDDGYDHWKSVINQHFNQARRKVFHHCIFLSQFHYKQDGKDHYTSSGLSMDIPGQCFIVANQSWLREKGNYGVAGTFMHELGHNLGLYHGGFNSSNEPDYSTNYKPNHLSVMNYLYQTSGLLTIMPSDSLKLDYSQVSLPDLNENYLLEANGIDPYGNTSSWLYRCIIQYANAL